MLGTPTPIHFLFTNCMAYVSCHFYINWCFKILSRHLMLHVISVATQ